MLKQIILETERTYLRILTLKDAENLYNLNLDKEVLKFTGDIPFQNIKEAREFLVLYDQYEKYGAGRFAVISKNSNKFMGWCGLSYTPELEQYNIGFRFFKDLWNKGFATETAIKCLEFAFVDLKVDEVVGRSMAENKASIKVLQKIGMTYKNSSDFDGKEGVVYQMTKSEYEKRILNRKQQFMETNNCDR